MRTIKTVLAIGAHPDDLELGCGATLAKLAASGVHVRAVVLTKGTQGASHRVARCAETQAALACLGVSDLVQQTFPDTELASVMPAITRLLEEQCQDLRPDRVYTMFKDDRHQDHRTVHQASVIACRAAPQILTYETPSSWPNFMPVVFETVQDFINHKIEALRLHESQGHREYMQETQIRSVAQFRGYQVGLGPSEGYIPYKLAL